MMDKYITCVQCGTEFMFSAAEQERFLARGYAIPKRCPECRDRKQKFLDEDARSGGKNRRKALQQKRQRNRYGEAEDED